MTTSAIYPVSGMTCAHCVAAVSAELRKVDGVSDVTIELRPGGLSPVSVTSARPLSIDSVRAAVDEAGYVLAD